MVSGGYGLLEVFELGHAHRYRYALGATAGAVESVPGCEGFVLDLDALWAEIDRLEAQKPETAAE